MLALSWSDKKTNETKVARFDAVTTETVESLLAITTHPVEDGSDVADHARDDGERVTIEGYVSNKPIWSNPGVENVAEYGEIELVYPKKPLPRIEGETTNADLGLIGTFTPGGLTKAVVGAVDGFLNPGPNSATVLKPSGGGGGGLLGAAASAVGLGGGSSGGEFPDRAREMYELLREAQKNRTRIKITSALFELEDMLVERLAVPRTVETGNGAAFQVDLKRIRIVTNELVASPIPLEARGANLVAAGSKALNKLAGGGEDGKKKKLQSTLDRAFEGVTGYVDARDSFLPF